MPLADNQNRYVFLCFDFDSKAGNAVKDAARLIAILDAAGVGRVATTSGPTGGRHVWVALSEAAPPELVKKLAQLAKSLWRSLDTAPLSNPATGSVRPPLSPHRVPGYWSRPDYTDWDLAALRTPTTTLQQLRQVMLHLEDIGAELPASALQKLHGVKFDGQGRAHLAGSLRKVSSNVLTLLNQPTVEGADLSGIAARILAGLARARYSFEQIRELAETAPGLEHFRTMSHPAGGRTPRTARGMESTLERKWGYAVQFVALTPANGNGEDLEFEDREVDVTDQVAAALDHASSMPGRWQRGGRAHRLVLDALCMNLLLAVRPEIEMDVRRLSLTTGYSRTTCAAALSALAEDGWIQRAEVADGVHGARWRLNPQKFSTGRVESNRTQGVTRAPSFGLPRDSLIWLLEHRLAIESQAIFAAIGSLGRLAGQVASSFPAESSLTLEELGERIPLPRSSLLRTLKVLHSHGLAAKLADGRWLLQLTEFSLRRATEVLGLSSWTTKRIERVTTERYVWAWWTAEVTWMRKRGKRRDKRASSGATPLFGGLSQLPAFPRYPRTLKRRGDHILARALAELRSEDGLLAVAA